jgi:hypothetical protein
LRSRNDSKVNGSAEELVENRMTARASYGFADRLTIVARLPFSHRRFTEIEGGAAIEDDRN